MNWLQILLDRFTFWSLRCVWNLRYLWKSASKFYLGGLGSYVMMITDFNAIIKCYFLAGEKYVSSWSPWSKCSKDCDGIQIRTRKCIDLSAKCEEALEEERDCSNTTWSTGCFCEYQECSCLKANKSRLHFALRFILMINMKSYNQAKKRNNMPAKHDASYPHLRKTGTVSCRRWPLHAVPGADPGFK